MPKPKPKKRQPLNTSDTSNGGDSRRLLTVRQVATLDGTSEKTVRRAIKAGVLQAIRVGPSGKLLRISAAAHKAYRQAAIW